MFTSKMNYKEIKLPKGTHDINKLNEKYYTQFRAYNCILVLIINY